ncbi:hypothetical protein LJC74_03795 [Eubacteriales bacterium OttesenSCG-928-A19]|nr:hypothetical protein [Eubacteriales bacterium OttesenSCG-928-A19]
MNSIQRGDRVEYTKQPDRFGVMTVISDPERFGGGGIGCDLQASAKGQEGCSRQL